MPQSTLGEHFVISLGETVSPGVPLPGAGEFEATGRADRDNYAFDAPAGTVELEFLYYTFDLFLLQLRGPNGESLLEGEGLFSPNKGRGHKVIGPIDLPTAGRFELTVLSYGRATQYSFRVQPA